MLQESEARRKAIVDNAVDGIITIDEMGIIADLNPSVERMFGYKPEELIGQNVKILMPDPYHTAHDTYLKNYRETAVRKIIGIGREVVGRRKDGTVFPLDLAVSEIPLEGGRRLFTGIVRDITERKQHEIQRDLLMAELSHRVKNTLATVIAIAQQTFRHDSSTGEAKKSFEGRIRALAQTHNRLAESAWAGASLKDVIHDELKPYSGSNIHIGGPEIVLPPKKVLSLGMAVHELVTNAAKHGALSVSTGMVSVQWNRCPHDDNQLCVDWEERNGPPVKKPNNSGFGRLLLEKGLATELKGNVKLRFHEEGLKCNIEFPI